MVQDVGSGSVVTREAGFETRGTLAGPHPVSSVQRTRLHMRQSGPDRGPGFQVKVFKTFQVILSSLVSESEQWSMPFCSRKLLDDALWSHTRTSKAFAGRVVTSSTGVPR